MTQQNQCPPVCTRGTIVPMLLVRLSLKVRINLRLIHGSPKGTTMIEEEFPLKVANMDFDLCVMVDLLKTMDCIKFWKTYYFFGQCGYLHILDII
jgi:hypothetical protein